MEMAAIRMCRLRPLRSLDQIIDRLSALERHLDRGTPLPPPPSGGERATAPAAPASTAAPTPVTTPSPAPPAGAPNLVLVEPLSAPSPAEAELAPSEGAGSLSDEALKPAPASDLVEAVPQKAEASEPPQAPEPVVPAQAEAIEPAPVAVEPELVPVEPASVAVDSAPVAVDSAPVAVDPEQASVRLDQAGWEAFVETLRGEDAPLAASLDHSQVVRCDEGVLTLGFRSAALTATQVEDARRQVLERLRREIGPFKELKLETLEQLEHSPFQRREIRTAEEEALRRDQLTNHPAVQAFVTQFDGELRRVLTEREAGGGG